MVTLQYTHKYNPSFKDVDGPFPDTPSDFATKEAIRAWFKKNTRYGSLGRFEFRPKGKGVVIFPASRMASSPHSIVVRFDTKKRLRGREVVEMASRLKQKGYSKPGLYARKLHREGIGLEGKWTEEPGPEGHRAEGGLARSGRRYVSGVKERLYGPRGGPGSLEVTHGFRDPAGKSARYPIRHGDGTPDRRFTFTREYVGKAKPQWVARFADKWLGSSPTKPGAIQIAKRFNEERWGRDRDPSRSAGPKVRVERGPIGNAMWHVGPDKKKGASGYKIYWNGPGARLLFGMSGEGALTPIDYPGSRDNYGSFREADAAARRFIKGGG